jgi:hypothetical protein
MATVTGTLSDFGYASLAPYQPVVTFTPTGPGVQGGRLLAAKPVSLSPGAGTGYFEVDLAPTEGIVPETWYQISISWLDTNAGWIEKNFVGTKLEVPELGGPIGYLVKSPPTPPPFVAWQPTAPDPWPIGLVWVNSITGDVNRRVS